MGLKQATDILQTKVDTGELEKMPPTPNNEWVRLQFIPNAVNRAAAQKITEKLEARRAVQTKTLKKEHVDQHYVNAMTRYYLEWVIELKAKYDGMLFIGQDDKQRYLVVTR